MKRSDFLILRIARASFVNQLGEVQIKLLLTCYFKFCPTLLLSSWTDFWN